MNPYATGYVKAWNVEQSKKFMVLYFTSDQILPQLGDICVMLKGAEMPIVFTVTLKDMINIDLIPESYRKPYSVIEEVS